MVGGGGCFLHFWSNFLKYSERAKSFDKLPIKIYLLVFREAANNISHTYRVMQNNNASFICGAYFYNRPSL